VTHNRNKVHIENQHFATQKQLRKDYTIKDQFILSTLNPELDAYRKKISELGEKLNLSVNSVIMNAEIQTLHKVWSANWSVKSTDNHQTSFNDLTNSIVSTGPFSFFLINFYDMSISHVSDSLYETHSLNPGGLTINDIPSFMNLSINENAEMPISFSKREIEIIKSIATGLNSQEIADKLFIADSTVKQHRKIFWLKQNAKIPHSWLKPASCRA
jgi:hypothetical protein